MAAGQQDGLGAAGDEVEAGSKVSVISAGTIPRTRSAFETVGRMIDELGEGSARAQGLSAPITTFSRLFQNRLHRIYLLHEPYPDSDSGSAGTVHTNAQEANLFSQARRAFGLLRVGPKNLFVADGYGNHVQLSPLCVLDFYIADDFQRSGMGRTLFEFMLRVGDKGTLDFRCLIELLNSQTEHVKPQQLAYDRPSHRLLAFLRKHYGLNDHVLHANNFATFGKRFPGIEYPTSVSSSSKSSARSARQLPYSAGKSPEGK
ncbi:Alpha-tubulin N-acetyltransferase 1 [Cladochytrium tenue]|nr:Alpha-tubulin N-acetyltransferase 1 [Cladochytrium tenue]